MLTIIGAAMLSAVASGIIAYMNVLVGDCFLDDKSFKSEKGKKIFLHVTGIIVFLAYFCATMLCLWEELEFYL